eukprot:CAMPEP_0176458038 /NCGR_PEP_ID=MMETSP0127-20121128/32339_1 /TAXON_ID=938130 /ORGANISM="Platyophrya macrostoma, Strain WH" /LENGTH=181 /DNA_ID=CAMNT_0017848499 /DNA_START=40 /DNA_END=585 /DNA_ORIENTATION=-
MGWLQNSLGLDVTGEWSQILNINVGGRRSDDGSVVIDRDGSLFRHVLNFMRSGRLLLPDHFDEWDLLLDDAKFYQLKDMEDAILGTFEYKQRIFRNSLPQAVVITWVKETNAAAVTPALPAVQSHPSGQGLLYQGRHTIAALEEAVATLLSVYGYVIQHWRAAEGGRDCVFLTLSPTPIAH